MGSCSGTVTDIINSTEQYLDQLVEYQCTSDSVTGIVLTLRILDDS